MQLVLALESQLPQYIYPAFRISGLIMSMPIIGTQLVPARIKIILVVALSLLVGGIAPPSSIDPFSFQGLMIGIIQLMIGVGIGMILHIIFQTFILAGQLIAQQMGLGFASMMDPQNGISVPAVGQLYMMMVMLMFLGVNGHLMIIEALTQSFNTIPIGFDFLQFPAGSELIFWGGWLFASALQMALPAVTALFLVNIAFGVMTKAAPQLNVFSIGFPTTMLVGILIIGLTLSLILPGFKLIFDQTFELVYALLGGVYD
jgi:flagellar biosynthesis protein FliR